MTTNTASNTGQTTHGRPNHDGRCSLAALTTNPVTNTKAVSTSTIRVRRALIPGSSERHQGDTGTLDRRTGAETRGTTPYRTHRPQAITCDGAAVR
ncbi:hypothetical protein GCM10027184_69760 [Saccharothrix stipae]